LLLAVLMLIAVTEALIAAEWSEGLEIVRLAMLGGALLSFMLALDSLGWGLSGYTALGLCRDCDAVHATDVREHDNARAIQLFQRNVG
jgi:hypothetical protein